MLGPRWTKAGGREEVLGSSRSSVPAFPQAQEDADYIEWLKGQREIQNPEALRELVSFHAVAEGLHCLSCLHPAFF